MTATRTHTHTKTYVHIYVASRETAVDDSGHKQIDILGGASTQRRAKELCVSDIQTLNPNLGELLWNGDDKQCMSVLAKYPTKFMNPTYYVTRTRLYEEGE